MIALKDYRIVRPLGEGGESNLFLATKNGHQFVVKLYKKDMEPSLDAIRKFVKISQHDYFVKLWDFGVDSSSGIFYEVQEYLEQGCLSDYVSSHLALSVPQLLVLLRQMNEGIRILHENGLYFGDIKPQNILLRSVEPFRIALSDYGELTEIDGRHTKVHNFIGSPGFAAPEAHLAYLHPRSDYWSVGMVVYWLLTGKNPVLFYELDTFFKVIRNRSGELLPIPDQLPAQFTMLLKGLLTFDADRRWGYEELDRFLAGAIDIPVYHGSISLDLKLEMSWVHSEMTPKESYKWKKEGFMYADALAWKKAGFVFREAVEWHVEGFEPDSAKRLKEEGEDPKGARLHYPIGIPPIA
ncbi:MAG: serine/threonine-protein kinase [Chlorobiaceae bacterium]|nr:serine/threonine-protein kinase [Chlorobiaceae bacterium]